MRSDVPSRAFTLIELLIVVAIIAILAAIAVPNFLEAQVRSKVSRMHADMRTLGIAAESYMVDHGMPPIGQSDYAGSNYLITNIMAQAHLTTPIAYLSSIPTDPFYEKSSTEDNAWRIHYVFMAFRKTMSGDYLGAFKKGYLFGIQSKGPSRRQPFQAWGMHSILNNPRGYLAIYDPSNGTTSLGTVIRTNKGILSGAAYSGT